jgi:hypothetical protein
MIATQYQYSTVMFPHVDGRTIVHLYRRYTANPVADYDGAKWKLIRKVELAQVPDAIKTDKVKLREFHRADYRSFCDTFGGMDPEESLHRLYAQVTDYRAYLAENDGSPYCESYDGSYQVIP